MNASRFSEITGNYANLSVAVVGDFCLDRYLEIDPARAEESIETGLEVHNVVNVRSQLGPASASTHKQPTRNTTPQPSQPLPGTGRSIRSTS